MTLSASIDPAVDPPSGDVVTRPDIAVVGHTEPGATVRLIEGDQASSGQVTTADAQGDYQFRMTVGLGVTRLDVQASDRFGQRQGPGIVRHSHQPEAIVADRYGAATRGTAAGSAGLRASGH